MFKKQLKHFGFTLSEVLIAIVVIGVVALVAVPTLNSSLQWGNYRSGVLKAKSLLDQAYMKYSVDNGETIECGYWLENPYQKPAECKGYDKQGNCTGWWYKETHDNLPADYNGRFKDCQSFYKYMIDTLNIVKVCDSNALANGCITNMKGLDTIYKAKNENAEDIDANKATAGISGFREQSIHNGKAFITTDGMIFIPYSNFWAPIMLVDVNGQKGPNKWGYDIHGFIGQIKDIQASPSFYPYIRSTSFVEKGGRTTFHVLYKRTQ